MNLSLRPWLASGAPYIWLNAGAVSISLIMVVGLIALIAVRGLAHFWPADVLAFEYLQQDGSLTHIIGEIVDQESTTESHITHHADQDAARTFRRYLIKTGNRDHLGLDFRWVDQSGMQERHYPDELMVVERREWGNLYGYLAGIKMDGQDISSKENHWTQLQQLIDHSGEIFDEIRHIEKHRIGAINYQMEELRIRKKGLILKGDNDPDKHQQITEQRNNLQEQYNDLTVQLKSLYQSLNQYSFIARIADGKELTVPLSRVVRAYRPNSMSVFQKIRFYFIKLWEFVSDEPREANTEGGIFPAIFGTVLMVMIMAVIVTPFGVVAAVYLHEYAKQGVMTRIIRIAVNNLAGVPSIVYGVFGLGFFVYFLGGSIDQLFFPEKLPAPTFGTPGLMWASITLAILTVPVVIVATEEGLSRVPRAIREGSLALGATKAETLWRTVLPMTASAMITGLILAIARAAGEVAPLMLVGVVKLAPTLPLDANYPFLHLDRKFMHLGFHIYDVGFQSPNVEAARPLVYATALLLVLIIIILNLTAIRIRNRLREKYRAAEQH
ncbi:MAG: phosphate ABC transporter, permease protein PstA [Gammaproteobacteria bacterium RIFCSPLOWO2_12_47_11]|nr:MAG: phosphate ABC transporter, permease protein PstA [Gammaproteobacteria bacterium RIFCSPLOWO2_12_47_11]